MSIMNNYIGDWQRTRNKNRQCVLNIGRGIVSLLFLCGCLYQCSVFLDIYLKHPTSVEVTTENSPFLRFPAVTFCNSNRVRKKAWCKFEKAACKEIEDQLEQRQELQDLYSKLNQTERISLGIQIDTFLISCSYGNVNCQTIISRFYDYEYTNCFTFNAKWGNSEAQNSRVSQASSFNALSGVSTELTLWMNLDPEEYTAMDTIVRARMTIHAVDNIPNPMYDSVSLNPGIMYNYGIRQTTVEELPSPHLANCHDYNGQTERRTKATLSQENCLAECYWTLTLEMCGCTYRRLALLYGNKTCPQEFAQQTCLNQTNTILTSRCHKLCRVPCRKRTYDYVAVDSYPIAEEEWLQLVLSHRENITKVFKNFKDFKTKATCLKVHYGSTESTLYKHLPKYAPIEVFSLLGGYIGLWLGASLYSVFTFVTKLFGVVMKSKNPTFATTFRRPIHRSVFVTKIDPEKRKY